MDFENEFGGLSYLRSKQLLEREQFIDEQDAEWDSWFGAVARAYLKQGGKKSELFKRLGNDARNRRIVERVTR